MKQTTYEPAPHRPHADEPKAHLICSKRFHDGSFQKMLGDAWPSPLHRRRVDGAVICYVPEPSFESDLRSLGISSNCDASPQTRTRSDAGLRQSSSLANLP